MARFEPFAAVRYAEEIDLGAVTAPPYDVIDAAERASLVERTAYNAVRFDLPVDEGGGAADSEDPYALAARLLGEWREEGVLVEDDAPSLYVYRMGYRDEAGVPRQTTGVLGALALDADGAGDVLPHEHTTPKAKSDRLALLRATRHNTSPIWVLSPAEGLSAVLEVPGPPVGRATDADGVHHRLWRVTSPAVMDAVVERVASAPVVVADGHHRYETCLAYRAERRDAAGGVPGPHDLTLALVVELAAEQLGVRAIHRLLSGIPEGLDVAEALSPWFEPMSTPEADGTLLDRMAEAEALALVTRDGPTWLLRPLPEAFPPGLADLDSSRVAVAVEAIGAEVSYQHGLGHVMAAVADGRAAAGVLLRPATVAAIAATAAGGDRMPPKTTYFAPKPRTGFVLRALD